MKILRIALVLALVAGAAAAGYYALRVENGTGELRLYGNVDIREVDLAFRVPGRLAEVRVDEGDPVRAGDLLAVLDDRPYRAALDAALAGRDQAAAALAKYEAGNRAQEIAQARALVEQLDAELKNAATTAGRMKELFTDGAVSRQALDDAVAARDALAARLQSARKALDLQYAGFRDEDVRAAAASLRAAQAAVDAARTDQDDTRLIAPSDGTVLSRVREPGAMAAAGAVVLVVSLDRPVWVRAYVPEPRLGEVRPGMAVRVYTDGRPDKPYEGTVGFVSPVAEFTPKNVETEALRTDLVYRLRVVVRNADGGLRQGMPVTVLPAARVAEDAGEAGK